MKIKEALAFTQGALSQQSDSARLDAELLLCYVLQCPRTFLYSHDQDELSDEHWQSLEKYIELRQKSTPMAYILGEKEFWSYPFKLGPHTLIPRPATECLIEYIENQNLGKNLRVLDLGTGSGAIAISLAKMHPSWKITATDIQATALAIAKHNAHLNQVEHIRFLWSDWFSKLSGAQFDMIISNPPYIDIHDPYLLIGDVQHEPKKALISPHQGLKDLEHIIQKAKLHLKNSGLLILEHGYNQQEDVKSLLKKYAYQEIEGYQDHEGHHRFCVGRQHV